MNAAARGGRCAPCEQREALAEPLRGAFGAEHPHPGSRELDCERQSVESPADARDGVRVRVRELEVGQFRPSALDVEPDGVGVCVGGRLDSELRHAEGRHAVLVLEGEAERDAARGEDPQSRSGLE